ncbi:TPA: hypothetical protein N0F65_003450 [Lagenidium giganteum]|uniref:Thioredoxin domain-containing protein n=1 Tax=Lagenidium giganteum TaxID=4803 RepID=A0AAV2YGU7_9STRA|nr:TPA: hypothetical protein N0F65_003450 [Lagenidium giganteum]
MAAKFSMATGLFGAEAHAEASDRMHQAMEELRVKHEREDAAKAKVERAEAAKAQRDAQRAGLAAKSKAPEKPEPDDDDHDDDEVDDDDDDDDAFMDELENDPELERLREARMRQLKQAYQEKQQLLSKGHGEYREIGQDEFLKEVTSSPLVLVHFYHRDFERCKIMDMHMDRLARRHIECKFLKINAEKAPFFVEKLVVRVLPTVICFKDGIAFPERVLGFEGLTAATDEEEELAAFGSRGQSRTQDMDTFPTAALARKLVQIGAIHETDDDDDDDNK